MPSRIGATTCEQRWAPCSPESARRAHEELLQDEAASSLALARVGREVIAATNSPELLPALCRVTRDVLQDDSARIYLAEADRDVFVPVASDGRSPSEEILRLITLTRDQVAPTLAQIIGVTLPPVGKLQGRPITEALANGKSVKPWRYDLVSTPGDGGLRTIVNMQFVGTTRYFSAAGFPGRTTGLKAPQEAAKAAALKR